MGLNIKNMEAHRLAEQLAKLTGETMTTAVIIALRERLERVRREHGPRLADPPAMETSSMMKTDCRDDRSTRLH